jgi:peptidoglycan/LPS O-acetylase OafA/YrhL
MPAKGRKRMAYSKLIAGLIGPLLVALGCAMLVNREIFPVIIDQISHDYGLIVLSGILLLLAGIAIVRVHNVWSGGWRIIVTLFGWAAVVGGLARMWVPQLAGPIASTFTAIPAALIAPALVLLALGGFLSYKAYGPDT